MNTKIVLDTIVQFLKRNYRTLIVIAIIYAIVIIILQVFSPEAYRLSQSKEATEKLNQLDWEIKSNEKAILKLQTDNKLKKDRVVFWQECQKLNSNTWSYTNCKSIPNFKKAYADELDTKSIESNTPTNSGTATGAAPLGLLTPDQLFYTTKVTDHCYISQSEEEHYKKSNWWLLATDVACGYQNEVYAPDFKNNSYQYKLTKGVDPLLWDYIELESLTLTWFKWVIWHIETNIKNWDIVNTGQRIGQTNISGATTWHHSHIELWYMIDGKWKNISYTNRSQAITEKRNNTLLNIKWWQTYYFTAYNLWDVNQNDGDPCTWASGKNLCNLEKQWVRTIALTRDVRDALKLNFWDKVKLEWPCSWVYQIEDEMNCRFRWKPCYYLKNNKRVWHPTWNVKRPWTDLLIKWDIPSCWGWAHKILQVT